MHCVYGHGVSKKFGNGVETNIAITLWGYLIGSLSPNQTNDRRRTFRTHCMFKHGCGSNGVIYYSFAYTVCVVGPKPRVVMFVKLTKLLSPVRGELHGRYRRP